MRRGRRSGDGSESNSESGVRAQDRKQESSMRVCGLEMDVDSVGCVTVSRRGAWIEAVRGMSSRGQKGVKDGETAGFSTTAETEGASGRADKDGVRGTASSASGVRTR